MILVYDGDCGFCQLAVNLGRKYLPYMPEAVPYQELDLPAHDLTLDEVTTSVHLLGPDALRAHGARAAAIILAVQPSRAWRAVGKALLIPPLSWLAEAIYRLISRYRHHLPGATPACAINREPSAANQAKINS